MNEESLPSLSVVMPAYNAASHLEKSLGRLLELEGWDEVIVVNPGSTDATSQVAVEMGARVIDLGHRAGPAEARNAGVAVVQSEIVLFVDSDCVAALDVIDRVRQAFLDSKLATLTGSYDDDPPESNFASLYMNLRHHYTHQLAQTEGATFWAGCGAVRKSVFDQVGGFDAELYPKPMIEDIELGKRMQVHGATRLDPELHATHLKRWTIGSVIHTDIFCRAIPWSNLIMQDDGMPNDLNLRMSQRIAALFAPLALFAVLSLPLAAMMGTMFLSASLILIAISVALNGGLVTFFLSKKGILFAIQGWLFHQLHLFYSAVIFVVCKLMPKNQLTEK